MAKFELAGLQQRIQETVHHIHDTLFNKPIPSVPGPMAIAYVSIISMAAWPIFYGSFLSLKRVGIEKMSSKDAYMFPFIGSAVLFGLYLLFNFFSKEYVNLVLTAYFLFFGLASLTATLSPWLAHFTPKGFSKKTHLSFSLPFVSDPFKFDFTINDLLSLLISIGHTCWYLQAKHWIANNIFGLAFSIQGVSLLSLGSYGVALILLGGLFVYDIFWVFFTDVMVSVAKQFDAPIKLLFPRDIFAEKFEFAMLGLGDIVIPGVFVALLLRFDVHLNKNKNKSPSNVYFNVTFVSYILGMVNTMFIMHTFKSAQPALLYLVPWTVVSSFTTALLRGEIGKLLSYSEEVDEKKTTSGKGKAAKVQPEGKQKKEKQKNATKKVGQEKKAQKAQKETPKAKKENGSTKTKKESQKQKAKTK